MLLEITGLDIAKYIVIVFQVVVCILLILIVMMQRPKQEGLGAAFGGDAMDSLAGAGATDFLQKGTAMLGTILFILTFILSILVISGASGKNQSLANESEKAPEIEAHSQDQADAMAKLAEIDPDAEATDDTEDKELSENEASEAETAEATTDKVTETVEATDAKVEELEKGVEGAAETIKEVMEDSGATQDSTIEETVKTVEKAVPSTETVKPAVEDPTEPAQP